MKQKKSWAYIVCCIGAFVAGLGIGGLFLAIGYENRGVSMRTVRWALEWGGSSLSFFEALELYTVLYRWQLLLLGGAAMLVGYLCRKPGDFRNDWARQAQPVPQGKNYRISQNHRHSQPVMHHTPVGSRTLKVDVGALAGRSYRLTNVLVIGRDPNRCGVVFPAGTKGVSGVHCTLRLKDNCVTVTDENSTYGTFVDGQRMQPGQTVVLHRGHRLSLGSGKQTMTLHS